MTDDLEAIRERKREELERRLRGGDEPGDGEGAASGAGETTPVDPVYVDGPDHLDELVGRYDVVLADFYADWCGPCRMLEPVLGRIAAETDATVAKIDADTQQALAAQYGVRGLPTLVLFSGGEVVQQLTGMQDEATLERLVEQHA